MSDSANTRAMPEAQAQTYDPIIASIVWSEFLELDALAKEYRDKAAAAHKRFMAVYMAPVE